MKMPKNGHVVIRIYSDGMVENETTEREIGTAVSLPEWHGRLTDADELFDTMRFHRDHAELNDVRLGLDEAVGVVMNAPTIVPAEGDADND